jgi:hypothetical protein
MAGDRPEGAPLWRLRFLFVWRAEHLGPEVAAGDRERAVALDQPWREALWDEDGGLRPLWAIDRALMRLYRDSWREEVGLPDGAAEGWP